VFKGNVTTAFINFSMSERHASCVLLIVAWDDAFPLTVVMALTTLYLQRRDQRRVALCEVKASAEDSHKGAETIDSEKQAQAEISPMWTPSCL
jgi:hypothetical protein